ncbi:hypothetical protein HQN87_14845 [Paenibacillus tritici]|uniref:Uncharacterized protein n=1 Tax=Paenibacillus tritici TaxID=1873425 RepID=A0ABX2DPQ8_9BACL|nr:hypothetical protein [Paenibacillus tritici]NQX46614.1 hypothetical protein [Paenibacillus tritici]
MLNTGIAGVNKLWSAFEEAVRSEMGTGWLTYGARWRASQCQVISQLEEEVAKEDRKPGVIKASLTYLKSLTELFEERYPISKGEEN